jgi:1-aminocyclopropane-1-carboxylate deaminase/D-cysteine desulfhydrase-like pyridoxal-dependent ACC family enzyme
MSGMSLRYPLEFWQAVDARLVRDADALTPMELHGGRWYKRDDLFMPYDDVPLSGGKVRQAIALLVHERERIVSDYGGVVLTATSVHSPQGLIIARVAHSLALDCVIFVGATTVGGALKRHAMLRRATLCGATLDARARVGYEPALMGAAKQWQAEHDGHGYLVKFGINLEQHPDAIIGTTAAQVANLPHVVKTIVVPVGAGITAAGIILGAARFRPDVRVVCVQISGYDRRDTIDRIVDGLEYDWHVIDDVPYSRLVKRAVDRDLTLDPIYEAKAYDWMLERPELRGEHVCFWVVGDSRHVRA